MLAIDRELKAAKLQTKMLLQIHDELVFEAPAAEVDQVVKIAKTQMETVYPLEVPLVADVGVGRELDRREQGLGCPGLIVGAVRVGEEQASRQDRSSEPVPREFRGGEPTQRLVEADRGNDEIFALRDRCPHRGGPLSQGIVHGQAVSCPLHNWKIDLQSGEVQGPDQGCVRSYEIKVEEGVVYISLSSMEPAA